MLELFALLKTVFTFDWLYSQLTTNNFLVTGIFGAAMYILRGIPSRIISFVNRQISIVLTVTNEDEDYQNIVKYLEDKRIRYFSRTYTKKQEMSDYGEGAKSSSDLTVGYGKSWFFINGTLGYIDRSFKESNHSNKLKEEIIIKLFTRRTSTLQSIITASTIDKRIDENSVCVYIPDDSGWWNQTAKITKRSMDSVFIPSEDKKKILDTIDTFLSNKEWYVKKGIPYKFGIFIEGEPGTGKSSLIKAISSHLGRNMYFMTADSFAGKNLISLISDMNGNKSSILVLEELDTFQSVADRAANDDNDKKKENANNMSVVLNTMDGILTPDNFMFIATSNYYDRIDDAIKRPGRFDLVITVGKLTFDLFVDMVASLYEVDKNIVRKDFEKEFEPVTGSAVQGIFIADRSYESSKEKIKALF